MDHKLTERLIGAIILAVLATALMLILFIDTSEQRQVINSKVPDLQQDPLSPKLVAIKPIDLSQAEEGAVFLTPKTAEGKAEEVKSASEIVQHKDIDQSSSSLVAWVVQLGSFSDRENALSLSQQLREAGYPAFIDSAHQGSEYIYRVRVGPALLHADAETLLEKINSTLNIKGVVLRYP